MTLTEQTYEADYEARATVLIELAGSGRRARITWLNGQHRSGQVGVRRIGSEVVPTLDGRALMGELCTCIRIEVMDGRRYRTVFET